MALIFVSEGAEADDVHHKYYGEQIGSSFGSKVANVGDVNGDGFEDVLVSATGFDVNNQNTGKV